MDRRAALLAGLALITAACSRRVRGGHGIRVISLSPSTTETVFAIGAGDLLVGRSRFCDFPPDVVRLPAVGGYADPSVEAIIALSPTLVVIARGPAGPALAETLGGHGIPTWAPETESIDQIEQMITEMGVRLGHEAGAKQTVATIEARRADVASAIAGKRPVSAAFLFNVAPIVAAGPHSFPDAVLREAGGFNVVTAGGQYPTLDIERLLAENPDVILDGSSDAHANAAASRVAALRNDPGWKDMRAVREGRVRLLSGSTVLRPGPRIGEGLVAMARALHGDDLPVGVPRAP